MDTEQKPWFHEWFNEDYLKLYPARNQEEAEQQVNFLVKVLNLTGRESVLDLGCGMGRHAIVLARKGFRTVGVDASSYLIDKAKEILKEEPNLPLRFIAADLFEIGDQGVFDIVLSMFTSFGYYDDDDENARVFKVVRNHLQSGGYFFLDYLHPHHVKKSIVPYEEITVDGEKVKITRKIEDDQVVKTISFPDRQYQEKVKLYSKDQIEDMLSRYRLQVQHCFNDYLGNDWDENGDRQIFLCKAL